MYLWNSLGVITSCLHQSNMCCSSTLSGYYSEPQVSFIKVSSECHDSGSLCKVISEGHHSRSLCRVSAQHHSSVSQLRVSTQGQDPRVQPRASGQGHMWSLSVLKVSTQGQHSRSPVLSAAGRPCTPPSPSSVLPSDTGATSSCCFARPGRAVGGGVCLGTPRRYP